MVSTSGELWLDELSDLGSWETWPLSGVFWVFGGLCLLLQVTGGIEYQKKTNATWDRHDAISSRIFRYVCVFTFSPAPLECFQYRWHCFAWSWRVQTSSWSGFSLGLSKTVREGRETVSVTILLTPLRYLWVMLCFHWCLSICSFLPEGNRLLIWQRNLNSTSKWVIRLKSNSASLETFLWWKKK